MDDLLGNVEKFQRFTLEFRGGRALVGNAAATTEYSYRLNGTQLELTSNVMGQVVRIRMEVQSDGSIHYMGMLFRKIQ